MNIKKLVYSSRSIRRFDESEPIDLATLRDLVDLARVTPSGMNKQWLRYAACADAVQNNKIFSHLKWAGFLPNWSGPGAGERPTGYILILEDERYGCGVEYDVGIAAQTMMLGARAAGFGGCIILGFNKRNLKRDLALADHYKILLVLALGKPLESVELRNLPADGSVKYWREEELHCVPKFSLQDVLVEL